VTPEQLHLRDEVLQVLYWLQGEGLDDEAGAGQLALWTGTSKADLEDVLELMVRDGWLRRGRKQSAYRFTEVGRMEGKRRFADAFVDHGLGWGGPGSCGPDCEECLIHGPGQCASHGHDHD
jgi:hypothetical protein